MKIDTTYYERCISTLEKAYALLLKSDPADIDYDMYRSASVKEFEIILEQSGKLLKKALKHYFHSSAAVDQLYFKDVFRHTVLRNMMKDETCERWLEYRDNRNNTAHDYGVNFAEETLRLLPQFIVGASALAEAIKRSNDF
ncbi:nucleotidyltransferase substrate binding protein [Dyadobacter sp. CY343]|uniref:nucleotidyltransferase substrate binding protein n=1 Tax=Dyadobacter sp. CY343 TaxID=2907299 RepID=UPI001F44711F|nr:nucleotidyltransferase substrate binding protein [Dyadobacter sp. CY343]MCE7060664.1 nucleotidyltransferase substrate binding protein [Dyadobacter sp. CY343]